MFFLGSFFQKPRILGPPLHIMKHLYLFSGSSFLIGGSSNGSTASLKNPSVAATSSTASNTSQTDQSSGIPSLTWFSINRVSTKDGFRGNDSSIL